MPLRPLILPAEVGQFARPCYADEALLTQIIAESEREDIRPRIGATLFIALKSTESDADLTGSLRILLLGGEWTDNSGRMHYLDGIKVALAYYTYGRVIRDGNITSTRYGAVIKSDDNSNSASDNAERQRQYRQAFDTADTMIVEAVNYITAMKVGGYEDCPGIRSNRAKMSVIGNHSAACGCESERTTIISGKEGPSAYDVAVANGFRGSVDDWLASLVGPQGPEGPQGPQGPSVSLDDYYDKPEVDALLADKASASDVETAISEEAAARENGDESLRTQIAALENNLGESIGNVEDKVDDVSASLAVVQSDLETEQAARVAADASLGARISNEETARKGSDDSLSESIAAEATKRGSEDSRIEGLIGIERNERAAADEALVASIEEEKEERKNDDILNASAIAEEIDARVNAETYLRDLTDRMKLLLGYNASRSVVNLQLGVSGKYVKCATRSAVSNSSFAISKPFAVDACSELLIKTGFNPSDSSHAALDLTVIAIYEEIERQRTVQKKNASGAPLYYAVNIDPETGSVTVTADETTEDTGYPVYTTETYTEQRYLPNNEDRFVAIPDSGYYVANIPQSCRVVVSYKPGVTDTAVIVEKHGALANIISQVFGLYEHRTMVEAMVSLAARVDALESRQGLLGNATAGTLDVSELTKCLYPTILRGHGVPAAATIPENLPDGLPWDGVPVFVGQIYINLDATSGGLYYATGHDSVSDWKQA